MSSITNEQILNSGDVLCRTISLYRKSDDEDPVETLISLIREAADGLTNVHFESGHDDDPYGGMGSEYLLVTGSTTGELRTRCRERFTLQEQVARHERIRAARAVIAREQRALRSTP